MCGGDHDDSTRHLTLALSAMKPPIIKIERDGEVAREGLREREKTFLRADSTDRLRFFLRNKD